MLKSLFEFLTISDKSVKITLVDCLWFFAPLYYSEGCWEQEGNPLLLDYLHSGR